MPEYLAPGVFIEEIEKGPKPIEGVATSTAAFLGEAARGPVVPTFITSYADYLRLFGSVFDAGKYLPYSVKAFFDNGGRRCYIARIIGDNAVASSASLGAYDFVARGPGDSGDRTWVQLEDSSTTDANGPIGFRIRVFYWDKVPPGFAPFDPIANPTQLPRPTISEDFDDLSTDPSHPDYYDKRVNNGNSALIEMTVPDFTASPGAAAQQALAGGSNGNAITSANYRGVAVNVNDRRGLAALELDKYRDVAIVHAPAVTDDINTDIITHCENNRFRFAVIDSPANVANSTSLDPRSQATPLNSQFAAYYYPWVFTSDPATGKRTKVPPGGFACGIYARTDNTRGVFKAPANETLAGALDLEFDIDHGTQENLNPKGVNCIRRFPGRGIRVWGARTLAADPLWKYVSVRRLFIFIEASIYRATQWVVFEPNDERLWNRVKQTVTLFLRTQWREGALFGVKEEEAFIVNVGRETMTEDDILNGRLVIELGIAPVRPAEFVIFRVYQKTQEASS